MENLELLELEKWKNYRQELQWDEENYIRIMNTKQGVNIEYLTRHNVKTYEEFRNLYNNVSKKIVDLMIKNFEKIA